VFLDTAMREPTHQHQGGGATAHVGDCYVWAEIYYLDSPTNYRECLPGGRPSSMNPGNELIMLDDIAPVPLIAVAKFLASIVSACMILMMVVVAFRV
jgi:hypothetical protein